MLPLGSTFGLVDDYAYSRAYEQLVKIEPFAGNVVATYGIGGTYVERPVSVAFKLVTDGTVANRIALVEYLDQGGVLFSASAMPFTVAASSTTVCVFDKDANPGGTNNGPVQITSLSSRFLQPTYAVQVSIIAGVAGDAVSDVRILVEKFSTAPTDFPPGQGAEVPSWAEPELLNPLLR